MTLNVTQTNPPPEGATAQGVGKGSSSQGQPNAATTNAALVVVAQTAPPLHNGCTGQDIGPRPQGPLVQS